MKLTTKSEYSLLALIYIARHQKEKFIKIEDICEKYDIPKKYLEHLLSVLKGGRYIQTRRGTSGGYQLAMPADKITMAEIIRLMDGALAPVESVSKYFYSYTQLEKEKKVISVFKDIRNYIAKKLENITIGDLV